MALPGNQDREAESHPDRQELRPDASEGHRPPPDGPDFLSPKCEPWTVGNLSSTHRRLRDAAGLPRDLVLYLARHRFGTEALRAGVPLRDAADLMGHASVTTTEIYLHRDLTELAGSQDRLPQFVFEPA